MSVSVIVLITILASSAIAIEPKKWWKLEVLLSYWLSEENAEDKSERAVVEVIYESLFHIGLDFEEKILTSNNLSAKTINALRKYKAGQTEKALQEVLGINLQYRNLIYVRLVGAILPKADLRGADLQEADLRRAQLRDANLMGADLRGADLTKADLQGANLQNANLADLYLDRTQLQGANLRRAQLRDADLGGRASEART